MIGLTRADLLTAFPDLAKAPKVLLALELLFREVDLSTAALSTGAAATQGIQNATVLTLSANDVFENERIVEQGQGIRLIDTGSALIIAMLYQIVVNGGHALTFNVLADTAFTIPFDGTAMVQEYPMANLKNATSDSDAQSKGVPVTGLYRNGSAVNVRVS